MNIYSISGYWKDDGVHFEGYKVSDTNDSTPEVLPEGISDDDLFFYGLSEQDIKDAIELGKDSNEDFVITSYELFKSIKEE